MKYNNHTFVICAYKESKYLEECILSLINQNMKTNLLISTSTPNTYIETLARKYNIPICINEGLGGITQDWNYALSQVKTKYATIAHQDDTYESSYAKRIVEKMEEKKNPLIAFSDYYEIRDGKKVFDNSLLKIKRIMLSPLRINCLSANKFIRRRILAFGDPISCPTVTFNLEKLQRPIFKDGFISCEDWEAWEKISRMKGDFVYISEPLMSHRIHEESTTTEIIQDNGRVAENLEMFYKFWPKPIAKFINKFYTKAEKSNELD